MTSTYKINLDLHEMISPVCVDVKKGETGRVLEITLSEDGVPIEIPSGTRAAISDNATIDACEIEGNKIIYRLKSSYLSTEGVKWMEVRLFDVITEGGQETTRILLYTATFKLNVYSALDDADDEAEASDDFSALNGLLVETQEFLTNKLIKSVEKNSSNQLVFTLVDGSGNETTFTTDTLKGDKGDTGDTGSTGATGATGADGKSAYQVAVDNGYEGTATQWLASLKGEDGADGADGDDGKSAYEVAVDNGYSGTESQWLASLKGADGEDGSDGTDGEDGESAYQVAVDNGFVGTESEWLASLKGEKGDPAYDTIISDDTTNHALIITSTYDAAIASAIGGSY